MKMKLASTIQSIQCMQEQKPSWLNKEATVAIKRKNNAYKKYRMNKSHYNEYKYRTQRNIATNEVRKAKNILNKR